MKVTTKHNEKDNKLEITVTLDKNEVKQHIVAHYKEIAKVRIPGFRPGRAPRPVLDQNYGGHAAVMAQICQKILEQRAPEAMDGEGVMLISRPSIDKADELKEGQEYTFVVSGEPKPELELKNIDPVEVMLPPKEASDKEVEEHLNTMRSYYTEYETIETDRACKEGDFAIVDLECKQEDHDVQGMNGDGRLVEIGAGTMPQAFEKELIGMKPGDTKEFTFNVNGEDSFSYIGEKDVDAKVTLVELREQVMPELDDEFAKKMGSDSIEDFKKMTKEMLSAQKARNWDGIKERECSLKLSDKLVGEVPESFLEYTKGDVKYEIYNNLQRQGATLDQFLAQQDMSIDDFEDYIAIEADEVAKRSLALDALAKALEIEVTDEDIDKEFENVEGASRKQWEESFRMTELREAISRSKAMKWLVKNAKELIDDDFAEMVKEREEALDKKREAAKKEREEAAKEAAEKRAAELKKKKAAKKNDKDEKEAADKAADKKDTKEDK